MIQICEFNLFNAHLEDVNICLWCQLQLGTKTNESKRKLWTCVLSFFGVENLPFSFLHLSQLWTGCGLSNEAQLRKSQLKLGLYWILFHWFLLALRNNKCLGKNECSEFVIFIYQLVLILWNQSIFFFF